MKRERQIKKGARQRCKKGWRKRQKDKRDIEMYKRRRERKIEE
jgi:hypothetical protein